MAIDKDLDFTGKTIRVTGSGRNIGRAIILEFAARGANVIIHSRTKEAAARGVEHEAQALGAQILVVMGAAGELTTVEEMHSSLRPRSCAQSARVRSPAPRSTSSKYVRGTGANITRGTSVHA